LVAAPAQCQSRGFSVFLVGDAGEDATTGPTLKNLGAQLLSHPNSAVVFLGDNCYKSDLLGLIPYGFLGFDSSKLAQRKVRSQLDILTNYKGYAFFIPGNHDWWNLTKLDKGLPRLKMEESFIEANLRGNKTIANPRGTYFPRDGDAGPDFIDLANGSLRIIFTDTYRLIITAFKKKQADDFPIEKIFYRRLDSLVKDSKARHQKLIVTGHHTLHAKGPNSKPLKNPYIFGRIKASNSSFPSVSRMAGKIRAILRQYPGIYYACGHVHSLQYFYPEDGIHYIISGAGSKTAFVSTKDVTNNKPGKGSEYLLWNVKGFFEIHFAENGEKIFLYYNNGEDKCEIQ
jgi:Calcineurin-like phosphoesterase